MKSTTVKAMGVAASCATGLFLALVTTASPAGADPLDPTLPPLPTPAVPAPPLPPAVNVQAAGTDPSVLPPDGIPHLASPDALPPGSTMDPGVMGGDSPNVSYLKDLWLAVQNHEISGKEALLYGLAQRGMDTPIPEQAPGPNVPISPGGQDPAAPPPPPAPPWLPPAPTP